MKLLFLGWTHKHKTNGDFSTMPQQIHISLGRKSNLFKNILKVFQRDYFQVQPNEMVISWLTRVQTSSQVFYGLHPSSMHKLANGTSFKFTEGNITRFTHKVTLKDLRPNMIYSKELSF